MAYHRGAAGAINTLFIVLSVVAALSSSRREVSETTTDGAAFSFTPTITVASAFVFSPNCYSSSSSSFSHGHRHCKQKYHNNRNDLSFLIQRETNQHHQRQQQQRQPKESLLFLSAKKNDEDDDDEKETEQQRQQDEMINLQKSVSSSLYNDDDNESGTQQDEENERNHLKHQQKVFDDISSWFANRTQEVPPELEPTYKQMATSILNTIILPSSSSTNSNEDDNDEDSKNDSEKNRKVITVLDVACGTGVLWEFFVEAVDEYNNNSKDDNEKEKIVLNIIGVDLSSKMVQYAKERAKDLLQQGKGGHSIEVIQSDIIEYCKHVQKKHDDCNDDDGNESILPFNGVILNACFGNFYNQRQVLQELAMLNTHIGDTATVPSPPSLTICVSHPLGASFVRQLHEQDSKTVPHLLPETDRDVLRLIWGLPLFVKKGMGPDEDDDNGSSSSSSESSYYLKSFETTRATGLSDTMHRYRGHVDEGYGRGGKKLGVPTANLPASLFQNALETVSTGVYFGFAMLERQSANPASIYKAVVNVGYSPTFEGQENPEKIIEAHLMMNNNDDDENNDGDDANNNILPDFYNVPMRLQLIGYLREEKKFDSFPKLIQQIHADINDTNYLLDQFPYNTFQFDTSFFDNEDTKKKNDIWIGQGGGDDVASWEFVPMPGEWDKIMSTTDTCT